MDRVKPPKLRPGGKVRVVAPASSMRGLSDAAVARGIRNLETLGLKVEICPQATRDHMGLAGTPEERAEALTEAFTDPAVDAVMCAWGGWNSNDLLPHLDLDAIRESPKPFIGYSDVTVLNSFLLGSAGLVNFQGPAFVTFTHEFLMPWEVECFRKVVMVGETPVRLQPSPTYVDDPFYYMHPEEDVVEKGNPGWRTMRAGVARGILRGGHPESLLTLSGTEYWPDFEGSLLFLEVDEAGGPSLRVLRGLRHLEQLGVFDEVRGVLLGRTPEAAGLTLGLGLPELAMMVLGDRDVPVVAGMDFGHTNPIMTLPVGVEAEVDAGKKALTLLEPGVT
ncbi:MAG: S66 peptidase family protein [Candidatus Bathyarchaeota archaeon]